MAWRRIGGKPLSEPMLIRFTDSSIGGPFGRVGGGGDFRFRPPSWISGHVTSGAAILDFRSRDFRCRHHGFPVTWLPVPPSWISGHVTSGCWKSRECNRKWKSKMAAPEVTWPEIQDGGTGSHVTGNPRWRHRKSRDRKSKMAAGTGSHLHLPLYQKAHLGLGIKHPNPPGSGQKRRNLTELTISPGRPKMMWPGYQRAVGCGQHLGTWWLCSSFFFFFFFFLFPATNVMIDFIHFWIVMLQSVSLLCLDHKRYLGASPHHHSIADNVKHGAHWDASKNHSIPSSTLP